MTYKYILQDGITGPLDKLVVDNSQLIQHMISSSSEQSNEIPILCKYATPDNIRKTELLLRKLVSNEKIDEIEIFLDNDDDLTQIADILNLSDFCDIKVVRDFLISFFAENIRKAKTLENLEKIFKK